MVKQKRDNSNVSENNHTENKIEYLQMIQEPICRMSTISAIFKGFAATIVSGVSTLSFNEISIYIIALSIIPVIAFACMDTYYLVLEKKYRELYEQVRTGKRPVNYSMNLTKGNKRAKTRIIDCVFSPSILLFYPSMILILIVVILLKFTEVI